MDQDVTETSFPPMDPRGSTGGSVHLKRRFNCTATGVVCAILCQLCHMLYIGETSRKLADHFGEHLRSVEGYNHNSRLHGGGLLVAEHFNLAEHNNIQDMKVSVVKQVNGGTAPRQREEGRAIFKLKTLAPSGMNIEFKFVKLIAHALVSNNMCIIGRACIVNV